MGKQITYKRDSSGKFCQIKYDDGNRILISMARTGARVSKLKWFGLVPEKVIFDISTEDLFSDKYKPALKRLTVISQEPDLLDVFKALLLPAKSLEEAKTRLDMIFKID